MGWLQCLLTGTHIWVADNNGVYCKRCGKRLRGDTKALLK